MRKFSRKTGLHGKTWKLIFLRSWKTCWATTLYPTRCKKTTLMCISMQLRVRAAHPKRWQRMHLATRVSTSMSQRLGQPSKTSQWGSESRLSGWLTARQNTASSSRVCLMESIAICPCVWHAGAMYRLSRESGTKATATIACPATKSTMRRAFFIM